jgi:hypothetical protein
MTDPSIPIPPSPAAEPAESCSCPACRSDAVALVTLHEHGRDHYWLQLRCGECGAWRVTVLDEQAAERFQRDYETHLSLIENDAARLDRERMEAQADVFAQALERDLIDAGDFARRVY